MDIVDSSNSDIAEITESYILVQMEKARQSTKNIWSEYFKRYKEDLDMAESVFSDFCSEKENANVDDIMLDNAIPINVQQNVTFRSTFDEVKEQLQTVNHVLKNKSHGSVCKNTRDASHKKLLRKLRKNIYYNQKEFSRVFQRWPEPVETIFIHVDLLLYTEETDYNSQHILFDNLAIIEKKIGPEKLWKIFDLIFYSVYLTHRGFSLEDIFHGRRIL